jgi:hypothetical protein
MGQVLDQLWKNQQELAKSELNIDEQFAVLSRIVISKVNELVEKHNALAYQTLPTTNDSLAGKVSYEEINDLFVIFSEFKKRPDFRDHFRAWYMGADVTKIPMPPETPPASTPACPDDEDSKAWRSMRRQFELDELLAEFPPEDHDRIEELMKAEGVTAEEVRFAIRKLKEAGDLPQKVEGAAPAPEPDFPEGAQVFGGDYKENDHGSSNGNGIEGEAEHGQAEGVQMPPVQEAHADADQPRDAEA